MQVQNIHKMMALFFPFLFLGFSFGCATTIQVKALEKEIIQLRDFVQKAVKEEKDRNKLFVQIYKQAEAAAVRAEKAALKAESAATNAERSVEIFLYEEKPKVP